MNNILISENKNASGPFSVKQVVSVTNLKEKSLKDSLQVKLMTGYLSFNSNTTTTLEQPPRHDSNRNILKPPTYAKLNNQKPSTKISL